MTAALWGIAGGVAWMFAFALYRRSLREPPRSHPDRTP
ncbi:hypothetical protein LMG27952_07418 [Paraburkholderia hiiakae]|uniref:Uncharacterized protein n=1 Tax=Paraburkholderia hiiakae TaxID=1081782 RepID=A0ABM8PAX6_9BURK|nr:hypothetical protein LMG27952_07418 [Paraburkholderia hiiakae]